MDSFRLLTRGSRLKGASNNVQNGRETPSEGSLRPDDVNSDGVRKRKRDDFEEGNDGPNEDLSVEQVRSIHKVHKVRFTNLRTLHDEHSESRKAQKEASRLFPQPLLKFSNLKSQNANHALISNLMELGYAEPTGVQLSTIPLLIPNVSEVPDLLTVAPTGSGKTLAFLIPLLDKVAKLHQDDINQESSRNVNAIILAPTKELVTQIVNEGRKLAARTGVKVTAFRKGMKLHKNKGTAEKELAEGLDQASNDATIVKADVLVSTPLSLLHAISPNGIDVPLPLPDVHTLILDEADVLLDPLFRSQTLSIWSACTNQSLQTSLWSATIGSNIEELTVSTIEARRKLLKIRSKNQRPLFRCIIGLKDSSLPNIRHKLIYASTEAGKLTGLRQIIRPPPSNPSSSTSHLQNQPAKPLRPPFLIFTQTIPRAQALYSEIQYDIPPPANSDLPSRIAVLHSDLPDHQRSDVMQNFRLGKIWILITTDLLSRGIDFRGVNAVINYDIPTTSASYVHRAGRTGRAGREGGTCVTLYTKDDVNYLRPIVNVITKSQKLHGETMGRNAEDAVPKWLLDSLPQLSKQRKKEIKERGVDVRRAVKESDDKKERRRKGRNTIGTQSGYEKKLADRRKGMIEGSQRRKNRADEDEDEDEEDENEADSFGGFD